jgi:molybdate transport system substrate-binding protein
VRVAAAADLAPAFGELLPIFEQKSGLHADLVLGSSGLLAQQIAEGAPFDVFAAADVSFARRAAAAGACDAASERIYARGRLVVWTGAGQQAPRALAELAEPRFKKIALANPEHAPYGRAAEQALRAAGILEQVRSRLVFGENVRQALQYAQTGNADAALVARSLVHGASGGAALPVDPALHAPLDQALVVCRRGADEAGGRRFAELVASPLGREVLQRHGFTLPEAR